MKRKLLYFLTLTQYGLMILGRWIRRKFDRRYDSECRRRIREYKNEQFHDAFWWKDEEIKRRKRRRKLYR